MRSVLQRVGVLGAAVGLLGVTLSTLPAGLRLEETLGLGWLFPIRGTIPPPSEAVIVALSSESAEVLDLPADVGKWPRTRHAELIERLAAGGPAAIAVDIMFDQPRVDDPDGDSRLAQAIERAGNVILAERAQEVQPHPMVVGEQRFRPIESLRRGALATAPFILPLVPVRISQSWAFGRAADTPSLPVVALHAYALPVHERLLDLLADVRPELAHLRGQLGLDAVREHGLHEIMRRLRTIFVTDSALADELNAKLDGASTGDDRLLRVLVELYAGGDSRYLNYYGPARTIATISYHEVLRTEPAALRELVNGRVVFVGFSEALRPSRQQDEFISVFSERSGQRLAGVEIGATMFANLLRHESILPMPLPWVLTIVAVWGWIVAAAALLLRGFGAVAATLVLGAAYAGACQYAFGAHNLWAPLAVPIGVQLPVALLAGLSWTHGLLRRQRELIRTALGYYLPSAAVDKLAKDSLRPRASRELVFGTCLVTDAEQYTTLSEALHPTQLVEVMDAYYDALVTAVHRHDGVVSDIGGDSMIAVWPATGSADATRTAATAAALEILAAVEEFNRRRMHGELPTRIGVDSGPMLLGNVGASTRGEYRAVGDIVNTAARLQGLNRLLGTRILVSAVAAEGVAGFVYRPLGEFLLVGKRTPVSVLELQKPIELADSGLLELNAAFADGLERFRAGDFSAACARFEAILERFPTDGASRFFLAQAEALAARPSATGWEGVVRVTVK